MVNASPNRFRSQRRGNVRNRTGKALMSRKKRGEEDEQEQEGDDDEDPDKRNRPP
jgi:hypothetical protein